MGIDVTVLEDQGLVKVTYLPVEVTGEDLEEQRRQVADTLSESGIDKVLIDASALDQLPPVVTILEHNLAVSAENVLRQAKFAVIVDSSGRDERFLETTGLNRGVQIKCFESEDSALSWLAGKLIE